MAEVHLDDLISVCLHWGMNLSQEVLHMGGTTRGC